MSIDHRVSTLVRWRPYPLPVLTVDLVVSGGDAVAVLAGEVDADTAGQLSTLVGEVLRHGEVRRLVLDLGGVTFFGAAGITALIRARTAVTGRGGALVLRDPAPIVRRVLAITGDHQWFEVRDAAAPRQG